jgi:hypothetical protein
MKKNNLLLLLVLLIALIPFNIKAQRKLSLDDGEYRNDVQVKMGELNPYEVLDTRIDNMRYWRKAAALGLTPIEPYHEVGLGQYKGNRINAKSVVRDDSPDVPVTKVNSTQSENSIFINPNDTEHVLQSSLLVVLYFSVRHKALAHPMLKK